MNTPLIDEVACIANVKALREALEAYSHDGSTQRVRTATRACMVDYGNGFRSFESCLAIAAAHIVFNPGPLGRLCANSFLAEALTTGGYSAETYEIYSQFFPDAEPVRRTLQRLNA